MRILLAVLLGILLGGVISKFLFVGSFLNLLPWGIVGLAIGWLARNKREALLSGVVYGFVLSFIFMVVGYAGTRPIISVLPFFAALGLFGGFCGLVLGIIGMYLKKLFKK